MYSSTAAASYTHILGTRIGLSAPMEDGPYFGVSSSSERIKKRTRCRYRLSYFCSSSSAGCICGSDYLALVWIDCPFFCEFRKPVCRFFSNFVNLKGSAGATISLSFDCGSHSRFENPFFVLFTTFFRVLS